MASSSHSYQAVFLVDIKDDISTQQNVPLVVIKILTRLAHRGTRSSVKWGYRFFDSSKTLTSGKGRSVFHDFGAKEFERFENEIKERLHSHKVKSSSRQNVNKHDVENPAEVLQNELKEVTEVFSWDRPDITSPGRPTRSKQKAELIEIKKNMLFILSHCPCSMDELTAFTEVYNDNQDEHFDCLMPVKVYRSFHEVAKIDLYWVDMRLHNQDVDYKGMKILDECLRRVGGSVIPVTALLQASNVNTTNIISCLQSIPAEQQEDSSTPQSLVLPVSCVVDYYTQYRRYETATRPDYISLCSYGNTPTELCKLYIHSTRNIDIPHVTASNDTRKSRAKKKKVPTATLR